MPVSWRHPSVFSRQAVASLSSHPGFDRLGLEAPLPSDPACGKVALLQQPVHRPRGHTQILRQALDGYERAGFFRLFSQHSLYSYLLISPTYFVYCLDGSSIDPVFSRCAVFFIRPKFVCSRSFIRRKLDFGLV